MRGIQRFSVVYDHCFAILIVAGIFMLSQSAPVLLAEDPPPSGSGSEERQDYFDPSSLIQNAALPTPVVQPQEQKISLELKGVDVLDVLKILSTRSGLNIVAGKNVRGQVTIYLKEVLIRDALDTIISTLGLAYYEERGIMKVMTEQEYQALYGKSFGTPETTRAFKVKHAMPAAINQVIQQLKSPTGKVILDERTNTLIVTDAVSAVEKMGQAIKDLDEPLVTEVFRLQYAKVADLETQFQEYLTPQSGVLKIDKRTNRISVTDRREKVEQIGELIHQLDARPPQVLIDAQIIEVALFDAFRYGIDWAYVSRDLGKLDNVNIQPQFDLTAPSSTHGSGTLSTFTFETDRVLGGIDAVVSILQNVGKTNTLSSPRVTVLNNEEAKLVDAERRPYVTSTVTQATTTSATADNVQFIDVGVTLSVVPTISEQKNTVVLKLKPEVSTTGSDFTYNTASAEVTTAFSRAIPIVSTQTLETTVIVRNGETLIVGGLIKDTATKSLKKMPFFGDLPVIGAAFRSETNSFRKVELVIFLTPHIVSGDKTSREHRKFFDSQGDLVGFDLVGGYDYALGQDFSEGFLRRDNQPFWRIERFEFPRYWAPGHLFTRAEPYQDHRNAFDGGVEGSILPRADLLRKAYEENLNQEVAAALRSMNVLNDFEGTLDFALKVRRDGFLQDLSFVSADGLKDQKLKRSILQTIRNASPFLEFPKGLDTDEELFGVRVRFQKDEEAVSASDQPES